MHHSHFRLGMVLQLGVLQVANEFTSASYLIPVLRLSLFSDIAWSCKCKIFVVLSSATIHHSHFKLVMVLQLGVLHIAYRTHIRKSSTSIFRHSMVKCQIFVALLSVTMHHSHFKLGMVLLIGVLHVTYQIHVHHLSTLCFTT